MDFIAYAGAYDDKLDGTAMDYLPGHNDAHLFYVYKLARNCHGEENCFEVPNDLNDPCHTAPVNQPIFVITRSYIEKETQVGPVPEELIFDRVIVFNK